MAAYIEKNVCTTLNDWKLHPPLNNEVMILLFYIKRRSSSTVHIPNWIQVVENELMHLRIFQSLQINHVLLANSGVPESNLWAVNEHNRSSLNILKRFGALLALSQIPTLVLSNLTKPQVKSAESRHQCLNLFALGVQLELNLIGRGKWRISRMCLKRGGKTHEENSRAKKCKKKSRGMKWSHLNMDVYSDIRDEGERKGID